MFFDKNIQKLVLKILGVLVFLNILAWAVVYNLSRPQLLRVVFFNVGQGDSIFIQSPGGHQVLIDGGPSSAVLEKLGKEMPFYDRSLDLIILTHPEKDHLTGLLDVLKRYKIDNVLWNGVIQGTPLSTEWQNLIEKESAKITIAEFGQKITLPGPGSPVFLDVLCPFGNLEDKKIESSNNASVVIRLVFGKESFIFTGDIGKTAEKKLISQNIGAEVLKIAHHGSSGSSSEEFLKKVSPKIAVISVGKNNYGQPDNDLLAILERFGIEVLRTDQQGDIKIISDGQLIKIIKN